MYSSNYPRLRSDIGMAVTALDATSGVGARPLAETPLRLLVAQEETSPKARWPGFHSTTYII